MKSRYYSLITGLSIFLITGLTTTILAEEKTEPAVAIATATVPVETPESKTTEAADVKEKIDNEIIAQMEGMMSRLEQLEIELSVKDENLQDMTKKYNELEKLYNEILYDNFDYAKNPADAAVLTDQNTKSDKTIDERAVKEYLSEYYVDVNIAVDDKKAEEKTEEKEIQMQPSNERRKSQELTDSRRGSNYREDRYNNNIIKYVDDKYDNFSEEARDDNYNEDEGISNVDIDRAQKEFHKAQKLFYAKRYNTALKAVNRSLKYHETALGYALEGSILYTMDDNAAALAAWRSALKIDPDMKEVRRAIRKYSR